ncbi:MAG: peroxide stress protein YaaA [Eubacteriales bacterium]|nr:peroxide stress protein YaaA [Eubacteriales bacterium]
MKIILSPAKKMRENTDDFEVQHLPQFLEQAEEIMLWLKTKNREELRKLWKCNDAILDQNIERLSVMDLRTSLTPAVIAYEGIAFQYMAPGVMEKEELTYLEDHLRILSAFYGILRPFDGVTPYRLEMQAKAQIEGTKDLYAFWNARLYDQVCDESHEIVNLASKEYSKCITSYLTEDDHMLNITFCEMVKGKLSTKGTYAKMARGEMVRYMAEKQVEEVKDLKRFDRLGYHYREDLSTETEYIFERR